tara:strand:- start:4842 stop:5507 length:666 start_codon:yes stop_codon:yes gene_type:complete
MTDTTPKTYIIIYRSRHLSDSLWNGVKQCTINMINKPNSNVSLNCNPKGDPANPIILSVSDPTTHVDFRSCPHETWDGIKITKNITNITSCEMFLKRLRSGNIKYSFMGGIYDIMCIFESNDKEFIKKKHMVFVNMTKMCSNVKVITNGEEKVGEFYDIKCLKTDYMTINFKTLGNTEHEKINKKFIMDGNDEDDIFLMQVLSCISDDIIVKGELISKESE